jgi:ribonuclease P protein component
VAAAGGRPQVGPAGSSFRLLTLKRRGEFLRVRKGARAPAPAFVLEGKARAPGTCPTQARFGFTVTRQVGNAVVRNRIRRRLKAAVAGAAGAHARSDFDYVLIARRAALERPFSALVADLVRALDRIDRTVGPVGRRKETRNTLAS